VTDARINIVKAALQMTADREKYWPAIEDAIRARARADTLAQRASDFKKLADTWQPLYETLGSDQKRRTAFLMFFVLREMGNGVEQRRLQTEEEDEAD
jgi:hypothetical protein